MRLVLTAIRLAFVAISRNTTRAALTVLGMLIGVAAVVSVVALAGSASAQVGGAIDGFGANALFIVPQPVQASGVRGKSTGRLTDGDARAIMREAVSVASVTSWLSTTGQVVYQDKNVSTLLGGVVLPYFEIRKYEVDRGTVWTAADETLKNKTIVIGGTVADALFGNEDPVGRTVRIANIPHRVVGVLKRKGTSPFGEDQDDRILMPIGSFRARILRTSPGRADQILASATSAQTTDRAKEQIRQIMRQRHRIRDGAEEDFQINTQAEFRQMQEGITGALYLLLVGVAAVSLLVGGIGVMNIMLVSVAERTREIGIRMSIGARASDILLQFLVEAVVLTMIGGVLGMLVGVAGTTLAGKILGWDVSASPAALGAAVGVSSLIGVAFGFLPARRAAAMDPIDALRSD